MDWMELRVDVDCPHCGETNTEHVVFNLDEANGNFINGKTQKATCHDYSCEKDFWFSSYCELNVEANDVSKRRPKGYIS